jgi:outer membrane protein OmpA-like peptidoglycan-associated protein
LEIVSTPKIEQLLPIQMAHLTFLYDCWTSKESRPAFRLGEMSKCKVRFYKLLSEIESYIDDLKKDRTPQTIIIEPEFERFAVMFDLNSAKINDNANKALINTIKHLLTLNGQYKLLLVGNTDRTGSELYNQNLSFKRVDIVKNYLIKNGVPNEVIDVRAFGEDFPDIITDKGMQQQLNRVVGIYVLKGARSFDDFPLPVVENLVYKSEMKKVKKKRGFE